MHYLCLIASDTPPGLVTFMGGLDLFRKSQLKKASSCLPTLSEKNHGLELHENDEKIDELIKTPSVWRFKG